MRGSRQELMGFRVYFNSNIHLLPALVVGTQMDPDLFLIQEYEADTQTLATIHDNLYPVVYRYVHFRLDNEGVCEDISSEVFLRLITALKARNHSIRNIKGWLLGTASHLVNDYLRMSYRRPVEAKRSSIRYRKKWQKRPGSEKKCALP